VLTIERVEAIAKLDDPAPTLRYAASEAVKGDDSWEQWVREYEHGEALIVRLEMTLEAVDGNEEIVEVHNGGLFVESHAHPPLVEQQIAEVASKDFGVIVDELRRWGHSVSRTNSTGCTCTYNSPTISARLCDARLRSKRSRTGSRVQTPGARASTACAEFCLGDLAVLRRGSLGG
jgi:hypothetical protein